MQPKKHSLEFLRENAHLSIRTNAFGAIMRVRSVLAHLQFITYFQEKGFVYVNTRQLSQVQMLKVLVKCLKLPLYHLTIHQELKMDRVNYKEDFFGKETNLTVSGQLEG